MLDGISDFFNGIFGGKKKDKKPAPQVQRPRPQAAPIQPAGLTLQKPNTTGALQTPKPNLLQPKAPSVSLNAGDTNKNVIKMTAPKPAPMPQQAPAQPVTPKPQPQQLPKFAQPNQSANIVALPKTSPLTVKPTSPLTPSAPVTTPNPAPYDPIKDFNAMDAAGQSKMKRRLQEDASLRLDNGDQSIIDRRNRAQKILDSIKTGGHEKSSFLNSAVDFTRGMADNAGKLGINLLDSASTIVNNGKTISGSINDYQYKTGQINKEKYIQNLNDNNNRLSEFTGGNKDRGLVDRTLRSVGAGAEGASYFIPGAKAAEGLLDGAAQGVSAFTKEGLKDIGKVMAKDAEANAAAGGLSTLSEGTDAKPMDFVQNTALGGLAGGAMRGAGEFAGAGGKVLKGALQEGRDSSIPTITTIAPRNPSEAKAAVDNGVITPATKSMSVDEKVQTALNSDIGERVKNQQTLNAFDASSNQLKLGNTNGVDFELGDFGMNALARKAEKADRLDANGVQEAIPYVQRAYRASDNPDSYRYDNIAWVADMPDGEQRVIYTRQNKNGSEEVINAHKIGTVPNYEDSLSAFGTPARIRTGSFGLERLAEDPLNGSVSDVSNLSASDNHMGILPDESANVNDVRNRLGVPGENISRSDMQQVQMENNRIFGDQSPNVEFRDGVMLTPDGDIAVGRTTDSPVGPSKIAIARQQGDAHATYLHESVHKALNDFTTQEERTGLLMSYAADKRVTPGMAEADIEELMAEDFIQFVGNRTNNDTPAPTVAQQAKELFEKVFKRLQLMTAKLLKRDGDLPPEYKQFYNDLFGGKYANEPVIEKTLRNTSAEHLALADHRSLLQEQYDNTPNGPARQAVSRQITELNGQLRDAQKTVSQSPAYRNERYRSQSKDENLKQTSDDFIKEKMPENIREYWNEMQSKKALGESAHPEQVAHVTHWLKKNSDKLLNEYSHTKAGIANARRDARVAKFAEFTESKKDAETLADLSPQEAKVEHINSKVRVLRLPGGDTATKVDVSGPRSKKVQEFAVRSTIDDATGKQTIDMVPLDGKKHTLKNGMVVDKNGKSVGSYAAIDDAGNQIAYVEGKPLNITKILGDIEQWGNLNKASWDMDRLIELNAPDKQTARRVQKFITQFKDQQESMMKTELLSKRKKLQELERTAYKHLPKGVSKKTLREDLFSITEKKMNYADVIAKYGKDYTENYIKPTVVWWRGTADEVLNATNSALERNGYDPIPHLDNYITHIQADPSFWNKVGIGLQDINPLGSSVSSDVNPGKTRGGIPEAIVGNTENTAARRKWNPFAQERRGSQHERDFFKAIDSYFEPMLFNKYMTPAASRTRVVERSFRMFEEAKRMREEQRVNELAEAFGLTEAQKMVRDESTTRNHSNFKADRRSPMITAWQEYGNLLAGKTNALDRLVIDKGGAGGQALMDFSTKAQGIIGRSTIPGSASAALAQTLSIPQTVARDGMISFAKAVQQMVAMDGKRAGSNDPMRKSAFMRARYTDAGSRRGSLVQRYTNKASIPMEAIERATGELSWRSAYNEALAKGLKGNEAILKADLETKKTLAGRGIADRPYIMSSKALGAWSQFGLEVNNMRIQFWKDFTPAQKIKFAVAAFAMNAAFQAATGNAQLPDYIAATFDTMKDFENSNDDKKDTAKDNLVQAAQRYVGETAKWVPGAASVAGAFMDDRTKEAFFGKNSDLSRFGTPPVGKLANIGKDVVTGDWGKFGGDAMSLAPTGGQAKKTMGGINELQKGYSENSSGNVRNVYDNTKPSTIIKSLIFGSNAIPGETDAMNSGRALSKVQTAAFHELYKKDPEAAKEYFNTAMGIKVMKSNKHGSLTDTGYNPDAAGATDVATEGAILEAQAKMKTDISSGKVVEKDGIYYTKDGAIKDSYYKEIAKSMKGESDDAYKAYVYGYGLESGTKYDPGKSEKSTGNGSVDALQKIKDTTGSKNSISSNAISLYKGEKKDVPDWVKERFYKEAGYSKNQVAYATIASYDTKTKLAGYYTPKAQSMTHKELMDELVKGRTTSIANTMAANDAVITDLQKNDYISKTEAKYLKGITVDKDGNVSKKAASGSGRAKKGSGQTKADISAYLNATGNGATDAAAILRKYSRLSFGGVSTKPRSSAPHMRAYSASAKKAKGSRTTKRML